VAVAGLPAIAYLGDPVPGQWRRVRDIGFAQIGESDVEPLIRLLLNGSSDGLIGG
jgi:hypothetical protein